MSLSPRPGLKLIQRQFLHRQSAVTYQDSLEAEQCCNDFPRDSALDYETQRLDERSLRLTAPGLRNRPIESFTALA